MKSKYLITGGAGFIGSNYAFRLLQRGEDVTIFDNLSRCGGIRNLEWLANHFGQDSFSFIEGDIRDEKKLLEVVKGQDIIFHLAAQVAVTTSVLDPREDFGINARGTFNVSEAARKAGNKPILVYASTNKVYGSLDNIEIEEESTRYSYKNLLNGVSESTQLDFHSPYGCSKGCGDQYVRDYFRIFDIPSVVLRQSCIYGPRQFGIEDQGWVAWFIIATFLNQNISIYGNGKQVRDILFIEDLLDLYDSVIEDIEYSKGEVFNIGGGKDNTISIWAEFGQLLEDIFERKIKVQYESWRPGDQKIYISDINKAVQILKWKPKIDVQKGIRILYNWVRENPHHFT